MLRLYGRSQGALEAAPFFVGCEQGPLREDDERRGLGRRRERARDRAIGLLARRTRRCRDGVYVTCYLLLVVVLRSIYHKVGIKYRIKAIPKALCTALSTREGSYGACSRT